MRIVDPLPCPTSASASFLYELLKHLGTGVLPALGTLANAPGVRAHRSQPYERVVLVAHSLGAVVSRWALVRAYEDQQEWRSRTRLLLFAPAHTGSDLATAATSGVDGFPGLTALLEGVRASVPLVKELDPGSRVLADLAERVRKMAQEPCLRASRVVVAEREVVVSNLPFPGDPCPDALRHTDHSTVRAESGQNGTNPISRGAASMTAQQEHLEFSWLALIHGPAVGNAREICAALPDEKLYHLLRDHELETVEGEEVTQRAVFDRALSAHSQFAVRIVAR